MNNTKDTKRQEDNKHIYNTIRQTMKTHKKNMKITRQTEEEQQKRRNHTK